MSDQLVIISVCTTLVVLASSIASDPWDRGSCWPGWVRVRTSHPADFRLNAVEVATVAASCSYQLPVGAQSVMAGVVKDCALVRCGYKLLGSEPLLLIRWRIHGWEWRWYRTDITCRTCKYSHNILMFSPYCASGKLSSLPTVGGGCNSSMVQLPYLGWPT